MIIKTAAVADYTPSEVQEEKIKKSGDGISVELSRTKDILAWLGSQKRETRVLCGFSMETQNLEENSRAKLVKKHLDLVAANNLKVEGAGFGTDTNVLTLITRDDVIHLEQMGKEEAAHKILDEIGKRIGAVR